MPCKHFKTVQTRVLCFHDSHKDGPVELHECTLQTRHRSSIFCLMHRSQNEPLPNPLDISSVAQEYSKNIITKKAFSVDLAFRKKLHSKERDAFARNGHHSLDIAFTADEVKQLKACMARIRAQSGIKAEYLSGHVGHVISRENMDLLLPLALRRALLTQDLVESVEYLFGVEGSLTLFSLELHEVPANNPEQGDHTDVTLADEMDEAIKRLAVTCMISITGAVTTMVYPKTAAKIQSEDDLVGIECIRATEDKNCVLFDASLAHKGSANNSSEPALRFALTFIQTSASERQRKWVQKCTAIKNPLNLSVAQFFCDEAAAAGGSAVPPASHGPAAGSGQPTEPPLPVQCPSPVTHCGAVAPCRARRRGCARAGAGQADGGPDGPEQRHLPHPRGAPRI